jgi:hypothetical protein
MGSLFHESILAFGTTKRKWIFMIKSPIAGNASLGSVCFEIPEDEEGPTAVYAKKVHKGGPDKVNRAVSKQALDKLGDLMPLAAHLDGGFLGSRPCEFRNAQARKIGSDFWAHADANALDYRS